MNEKASCEKVNYYKDFGYKYCQIFKDSRFVSKRSAKTQTWLNEVSLCLMYASDYIASQNSEIKGRRQCKQIKRQSFDVHSNCYVDTGFCEIDKK